MMPPLHPSLLPTVSVGKVAPAAEIVDARAAVLKANSSVKLVADRTLVFAILLAMCGYIFTEPLIYSVAGLGVLGAIYGYAWLRTTGAHSAHLMAPVTAAVRAELSAIVAASPAAREYCVQVGAQKRGLTLLELRALSIQSRNQG